MLGSWPAVMAGTAAAQDNDDGSHKPEPAPEFLVLGAAEYSLRRSFDCWSPHRSHPMGVSPG